MTSNNIETVPRFFCFVYCLFVLHWRVAPWCSALTIHYKILSFTLAIHFYPHSLPSTVLLKLEELTENVRFGYVPDILSWSFIGCNFSLGYIFSIHTVCNTPHACKKNAHHLHTKAICKQSFCCSKIDYWFNSSNSIM